MKLIKYSLISRSKKCERGNQMRHLLILGNEMSNTENILTEVTVSKLIPRGEARFIYKKGSQK